MLNKENVRSEFSSDNLRFKFTLVVVCVVLVILTFGYVAYPPTHGDAAYFLPTAINFSLGHGFTNEVSSLVLHNFEKSGSFLDNTYVPGFKLFLGLILKGLSFFIIPSSLSVVFIIAILNSIAVFLMGFIFYKIFIKKYENISRFYLFIFIAHLLAFVGTLHIGAGRPESLARLFLLCAIILVFYLHKTHLSFLWPLLGFLLGLMGVTQPVIAFSFGLLISVYFGIVCTTRQAIQHIIKTYLLSFFVFYGIFILSPIGFSHGLTGIWGHFHEVIVVGFFGNLNISQWVIDFFRSYFFTPDSMFFGVILCLFSVFAFQFYSLYKSKIASQKIFLLFTVLFFIAQLYSFLFPPIHYNIVFFSPIFLGFILYYVLHMHMTSKKIVVSMIVMLLSIGFFYSVFLFPFYLKGVVSLNQARAFFNRSPIINGGGDDKIMITPNMWLLSEKYASMDLYKTINVFDKNQRRILVLEQGNYGGSDYPLNLNQCELKEDYFAHYTPKILDFRLPNTNGYAFAVYVCQSE